MNDTIPLDLNTGSSVGVIGGGPAGSFFSYFILQYAKRIDVDIRVDIYERRDFTGLGPAGCNMCAGVISESLIQSLSVEGINLPSDVVQRGINSFVLHTNKDSVTMYAPFHEMRIATAYRGGGPRGAYEIDWKSLDNYLLELAGSNGANVVRERVTDVTWDNNKPQIHFGQDQTQTYDLIVGAVGVNSPSLNLFEKIGIKYRRPKVRKTFNCELPLGSDLVTTNLGSAMHAFLLNLPGLEFAALVPKGNYATMSLIGDNIDSKFVDSFMLNPAVREHISNGGELIEHACHCAPYTISGDSVRPYGDRVVLIGDCGMSRLNKDGIGSAYRAAKVAAITALYRGISYDDFQKRYQPLCKSISNDNGYGKLLYFIVGIVKKASFLTNVVIQMTKDEQRKPGNKRQMSMILWDMFTGSAPYREIFFRSLNPRFIGRFIWNIVAKSGSKASLESTQENIQEIPMGRRDLGKIYHNGEIIVNQGESGSCMYVIQAGQVEVLQQKDDTEVRLAILDKGDILGEMALFEHEIRSATVRALGDARVLTIDKRIFLRRVQEDPSFAFTILQKMSHRIRELNTELLKAKSEEK
jgi:flavin-dependent dehydrogenase